MPSIGVSVSVNYSGGSLELHNPALGYEVDAETRNEYAVSWRKTEVSNRWVEGTYLTNAVRENVVESLGFYVRGSTSAIMKTRLNTAIQALSDLYYTIVITLDGVTDVWECQASDYSITTQHEFLHSKMARVKAKIPRKPFAL